MRKAIVSAITLSVLLPLIRSPHLYSDDVGGKTVFIRGLVFGVLFLIALLIFLGKNNPFCKVLLDRMAKLGRNRLVIAVAASTALLALSTLFAYNKAFAFFGEISRTEGFLTIFSFSAFLFLMALVFEKKDWNRYFLLTSIVGMFTFVITLFQVADSGARPDAWLGNPMYLCTYYLFALTTGGYVFLEARKNKRILTMYFGVATILASIIGVFLTQSRAGILALFVAVLVGLVVVAVKGKARMLWGKTLRFWTLLVFVAIIVFSGIFLSTRHADFWQKIPGLNRVATSNLAGETIASRAKITKLSINGFFGHSNTKTLLLGWGWDNYVFFYQQNYDPSIFQYEELIADRAHDKLIDVLVMSGILGLISYMAIWFFLFKYCLRLMREHFPFGLVTLVFLVAFFVNNLFGFDVAVSYLALYSIAAFLVFTHYERV
ncbi:MAG: hypothetical protein RL641_111 [Candidatus Parcubacteria bacterium]|jgi:hypothetical protein